MKKLIIRFVATFALLLVVSTLFGVFRSPAAHASARMTLDSAHTTTAATSPDITIVNCTDPNFFTFYTLDHTTVCFANAGYTPATIPNVYAACSGNNTADIYTESGTYYAASGAGCHGFPNGPVTVIGINIH